MTGSTRQLPQLGDGKCGVRKFPGPAFTGRPADLQPEMLLSNFKLRRKKRSKSDSFEHSRIAPPQHSTIPLQTKLLSKRFTYLSASDRFAALKIAGNC